MVVTTLLDDPVHQFQHSTPPQIVDGNPFDLKDLQKELPLVQDGQISLSDLLGRVVQAIYAEMTEIAETSV